MNYIAREGRHGLCVDFSRRRSRLPGCEHRAVYVDDEFFERLNHEVRGPLAPIAFGIEILKFRSGCDQETLAMMERQVERLRTVLEEIRP